MTGYNELRQELLTQVFRKRASDKKVTKEIEFSARFGFDSFKIPLKDCYVKIDDSAFLKFREQVLERFGAYVSDIVPCTILVANSDDEDKFDHLKFTLKV